MKNSSGGFVSSAVALPVAGAPDLSKAWRLGILFQGQHFQLPDPDWFLSFSISLLSPLLSTDEGRMFENYLSLVVPVK